MHKDIKQEPLNIDGDEVTVWMKSVAPNRILASEYRTNIQDAIKELVFAIHTLQNRLDNLDARDVGIEREEYDEENEKITEKQCRLFDWIHKIEHDLYKED